MSDIKKNQRIHAVRRAQQRYGITITNAEYEHLCTMVKFTEHFGQNWDGCQYLQANKEKNRHEYRIRWMGVEFYVIWDRKTKRIVTFFKPEWSMKYKQPQGKVVFDIRIE